MKSQFILSLIVVVSFISANVVQSGFNESNISLEVENGKIEGTLLTPKDKENYPVVLIIPGSGPTNRNGNNQFGLNTNAYKMLAETLAENGIAVVRFDKRGIGESIKVQEELLSFEDYINDGVKWIKKLKENEGFDDIFILGHSEGSLVGILAAQKEEVDGLVSVAGTALNADSLILNQLAKQPRLLKEATQIIDSLKMGKEVERIDPTLLSLFRPSVQSYLMSWFAYNPTEEIKELSVPMLIIQGTSDIQVATDEAKVLASANPKASLKIIEGMNHIFKNAPEDNIQANLATYSDPDLPLNKEFEAAIIEFIQTNSQM